MNKAVQILLLCALLPLASHAREETLEERKQRIMRKYMRENATVSESDLYVAAEQPEDDERVTESEGYGQTKDAFERQESMNTPAMPRRPLPIPRQPERSNWLFDDVEMDEESDPYADPFALDKAEKKLDVKRDWSQWSRDEQQSSSIYGSRDSRYESSYGRQQDRTGIQSGTYRSYLNPGTANDGEEGTASLYGSRDSNPYGTRTGGTYSTGRLGEQQESRTYGSSPGSGMLTTPYPQLHSGYESDVQQQGYPSDRTRSYTPSYRTPSYSTEQRGSSWSTPSSSSQSGQQQEYQQPSSFQKWKQRETYDPSAKDPFGK